MVNFYLYGGKMLLSGGDLAIDSNCCCSDPRECVDCELDTHPRHASVQIGGIANKDPEACPNCTNLINVYDLGLQDSPLSVCCLYYSEENDCSSPDNVDDFLYGNLCGNCGFDGGASDSHSLNVTLSYGVVSPGVFRVNVFMSFQSNYNGICETTGPTPWWQWSKDIDFDSDDPDCVSIVDGAGSLTLQEHSLTAFCDATDATCDVLFATR